MIILSATTSSLEVVMSAGAAANQSPVVASYVDLTTTTFLSGSSTTATNSTTPVTIVAAPAASTQRQVKYLSFYNADTAAITLLVKYNANATLRTLVAVTLAVGSTLVYTDGEGWRVIDASGVVLSGQPLPALVSLVATNQTTAATSLTNIAGLSLAVLGNATYQVSAALSVASSTADGALYGIACTSSGSAVEAQVSGTLAAATTRTERLAALATATSALVTVAADGAVLISAVLTTGALAGALTIQQACAVGGTVTTYAKSRISAVRIG